jgi:hypothetical protein
MQNVALLLEKKQSRTGIYADVQVLFKRSLYQEGILLQKLKVRALTVRRRYITCYNFLSDNKA